MEIQTEITEFKSWKEFRDYLLDDRRIEPPIYRGQYDPTWRLASQFERILLDRLRLKGVYPYESDMQETVKTLGEDYYKKRRRSALRSFQKHSRGCRGESPQELTEEQWWILGRHYSLITPILDWTSSPYIASWFAFQPFVESNWIEIRPIQLGGYVAIWELEVNRLNDIPKKDGSYLKLILDPDIQELSRNRIQQSLYTELYDPNIFEIEGYLKSKGKSNILRKLLVPTKSVSAAISDLEKMNINNRTLFDDLDGAARQANWNSFKGSLYASAFLDSETGEPW